MTKRVGRSDYENNRAILRTEWEGIWAAQDRALESINSWCPCESPIAMPTYLGRTPCKKCGKWIQSIQLRSVS